MRIVPILLAFSTSLFASAPALAESAAVGKPAPDFELTDTTGKTHKLSALKGKTVVLEWTNPGCPFVKKHVKGGTMNKIMAANSDVVFLAINSTNKGHQDYLTPADYQKWAKENNITHPQLYDADGKVGTAYGAKTTPHMYIVDKGGMVVYAGAMDDKAMPMGDPANAENYVAAALKALAAGQSPNPAQTKPYGCSVKYE
ncbi:MAG: redoxin domain-containing protein [Deltaproteobacteria bacterium]|nr:redoxin domain-containing protein [Deltaproteobacteria bacterium]